MATKTTITLIDDLDGSEAAESVEFQLDGVTYRIDLSRGNAHRLREAFSPYVMYGAIVRSQGPKPVSNKQHQKTVLAKNQAIREWARANGEQIADRGRIPYDLIGRYNAAHS